VRYSGTEPKLRLLVEARDEAVARRGLDRLEAAARTDLSLPSVSC
jgi:phosphoglucosamine mutase